MAAVMYGRQELERHALGRLGELFGPDFAVLDTYRHRIRLPGPPMLLIDRVTEITADARGGGTIRTETDVGVDSWFLDPAGRMPASLVAEAGQGDLLLLSRLGADRRHTGDRRYRLLGGELIFHGPLPRAGQILSFDIRSEGRAQVGGGPPVFFSSYDGALDGRPCVSLRSAQAGLFTAAELAASPGVRWTPRRRLRGDSLAFGPAAVREWAAGVCAERMLLLHQVTCFDPAGGYLRAVTLLDGAEWFFADHFKDDPCMPGTLMLEGALQAMAFCLTALGHGAECFEPVPGRPMAFQVRRQVTPLSRRLEYEVFVSGVADLPRPALYADVLCHVDGVPALHLRGAGVRWREEGPA